MHARSHQNAGRQLPTRMRDLRHHDVALRARIPDTRNLKIGDRIFFPYAGTLFCLYLFEVYLNDTSTTAADKLITELYLPLRQTIATH